MEEAYHKKIEENRRTAEERTAKKRAKRLKKKGKKQKKEGNISNTANKLQSTSESEANSSDSEEWADENSTFLMKCTHDWPLWLYFKSVRNFLETLCCLTFASIVNNHTVYQKLHIYKLT